jgi:hypothetical protein
MRDNGYTRMLIQAEDQERGPYVPEIVVYMDAENGLDDSRHIFHIAVGSFIVHLVGERSELAFVHFTDDLRDKAHTIPFFAGFIDKHEDEDEDPDREDHLPGWTRKRKIYLVRLAKSLGSEDSG